MIRTSFLLSFTVACGPGSAMVGDGPCAPGDHCQPGLTTTTSSTNPGTGPGAGAYRVVADISYSEDDDSASIDVVVLDPDGNEVDGVGVWVQGAALTETEPGRFEGDRAGYDRVYDLGVEGPSGPFWATATGPGLHTVALPAEPWDVAVDHTVTWTPAGADRARVRSEDGDWIDLAEDLGTHTFVAGTLAVGEERIRVHRTDILELIGGAPGSSFDVGVETDDDVQTEGVRSGSLFGELRAEGDFQNEEANAYVLAWGPSDDPDLDPPAAFLVFEDFRDQDDYELLGLAAGDWTVLAYLDLDGSDVGLATPAGPTDGDGFAEETASLEAGQDRELRLRMEDTW